MDPTVEIIQKIEEEIALDVFLIIIDFVEEYHIDLGREKWKENIIKLHEEYKRLITISWRTDSVSPWEEPIQEVSLVSWQNHTDPEEFDHDYSCSSFNHRGMDFSCYNTEEKRKLYVGKHWCPLTIANAMNAKSTFTLIPQNYYYQKLYTD